MEMLLLYLVFAGVSVQGLSLWSLSHVSSKELDFNVQHDSKDSVRVEAFVQDSLLDRNNQSSLVKYFLATTSDLGISLKINDNASLRKLKFNFNAETKVLIHGFANSASSDFITLMKKAYLTHNCNILIVDWSLLGVPPFYSSAVDNASQVGVATADFLSWLVSQGLSLSRTHVIGHSVGAHIAGAVGRYLMERGVGRLARITGLDLAKPMFDLEAASFRLSLQDADFVDCVHTCGGFLGLSDATCHADFYPNGGTSPQPGCKFDFLGMCSHQRAYKYYVESITHSQAFKAVKCSAIEGYSPTGCSIESETYMGEYLDNRTRGIFYFATASMPPFSLKASTKLISEYQRFIWYFV